MIIIITYKYEFGISNNISGNVSLIWEALVHGVRLRRSKMTS